MLLTEPPDDGRVVRSADGDLWRRHKGRWEQMTTASERSYDHAARRMTAVRRASRLTWEVLRHRHGPLEAVSPNSADTLSHRQVEIIQLLRRSRSDADIARTLGVTVLSVQRVIRSVVRHLELADRADLVRWSARELDDDTSDRRPPRATGPDVT